MTEKSRWQAEYDALPTWAKRFVDGMRGFKGHGSCACQVTRGRNVYFIDSQSDATFEGICGAIDLAAALTAPWPPPAPPAREKRAVNVVEIIADQDECAFDQPCAFGHRVESHAVYCHNEAWPDSPRKCRRNRQDFLHEECPGFVRNPDTRSDQQ